MEIKYTCPLGSECETAKDNILYRCRWYIKLRGKDPQTGDPVDEFRCAYEWNVLLAVENTGAVSGVQAATESFRNEMVNQNANLLTGLVNSVQQKQLKNED